MESYLLLEQLPFPAVDVIAKHCSPQEMAACCAVSSQMREVFGENMFWRRYCTEGLADHLRNTPCRVQPSFVSPESENSTLSPISPARLDFMYENHLWNNWRRGRNKRQEIAKESEMFNRFSIWDRFFSNDYVMSCMDDPKRIEIFDVRKNTVEDAIPAITENVFEDIYIAENRMCFIKNNYVKVYHLDFETKKNTVEHVFYFDKTSKEESSSCYAGQAVSNVEKCKSLMIGTLLVGIKEGDAALHIWNVDTGKKICKQECPLQHGVIEHIKEADSNLILNLANSSNKTNVILVYNLKELAYQYFTPNLKKPFEYEVTGQYLAILSHGLLNVFDYTTSEAVLKDINADYILQRFKNCFIFMHNNQIVACNPRSQEVFKLPLNRVHSFKVMSDKFLQVIRYHRNELSIWEFQTLSRHREIRTRLDLDIGAFYINKANTRYIVRCGSHGTLIHFW